jgi:hypothetical protein
MWWKYGWCHTLEKMTVSLSSSNKMVQCPNFYQCGTISQKSFLTEIKWLTSDRQANSAAWRSLDLIWLVFFFYRDTSADSPCTQCLRILIYPKFAFQVAINQKTHKHCPMFGMRMVVIFVCHQWGSHWNPVGDNQDSQISSIHLWIL